MAQLCAVLSVTSSPNKGVRKWSTVTVLPDHEMRSLLCNIRTQDHTMTRLKRTTIIPSFSACLSVVSPFLKWTSVHQYWFNVDIIKWRTSTAFYFENRQYSLRWSRVWFPAQCSADLISYHSPLITFSCSKYAFKAISYIRRRFLCTDSHFKLLTWFHSISDKMDER